MCTLVSLINASCPDVYGGVRETWITSCDYVSATAWDANSQLTNFTMTTPGKWTRFVYDKDDTSKLDSVWSGTGKVNKYKKTFEAKFAGLDNTKRMAGEALDTCCCLIAVHFLNNGKAVVQGIEKTAATPFFRTENTDLKAKTDMLFDTGANEDRLRLVLESEGRYHPYFTTLTETALAAL